MGPLVLHSVALSVGLVAAQLLGGDPFEVLVGVATLATTAYLLLALRRPPRQLHLLAVGLTAALAVGGALGAPRPWREPAVKSGEHVVVGEALRVTRGSDGRMFALLRVRGAALVDKDGVAPALRPTESVELRLALADAAARQLRPGDQLLFRVRGFSRRNRRNFGDAVGPFAQRGLFGVVVAGPLLVREAPPWTRAINDVRAALRRGLEQTLSPPSRALAAALILGDRTELAPDTVAAFRRTGAAHLLAVSGLQVAVVGYLCQWLVTVLLLRTPLARRSRVAAPAALLAVAVCWGYAALTGLAPPAFRAAVMITAALLAQALGRPTFAGRAIWLAAAVLLVGEPTLIWRPGFQLSFAAVFALSGLGRPRRAAPAGGDVRRRWLLAAVEALARAARTSVAATLATAPLVAHHFGLFSPWGVVINMVAVPIMGLFLLPGTLLVTFASAVCLPVGRLVALVVDRALELFVELLCWASGLPGACVAVPRPNLLEAVVLVVAGLLLVRPSRVARVVSVALLALGVAAWGVRLELPRFAGELRVTFIDVGGGDATLIELPRGGRVLVDAGPRASRSTRMNEVVTALQRSGSGRLGLLVLTHAHGDHAAGLPGVIEQVGAERYWPPLATDAAAPFATLAGAAGSNVVAPTARCRPFELGGVRFEVLHPCRPEARLLSENDRSLVLRLVHGRTAILLPGDIEGPAEELLLRHRREQLRATVLKLAHHGSDTSSADSFLDAVGPRLAIASCGSSLRRPLPHPEVERRLRRRGVTVLSTARHGALRLATDGTTLRVTSARSGVLHLPRPPPLPTSRASENMRVSD